ncbi:MAG: hypothetical protein ACPGQL_08280 [Thermoplasmatota archaeon]
MTPDPHPPGAPDEPSGPATGAGALPPGAPDGDGGKPSAGDGGADLWGLRGAAGVPEADHLDMDGFRMVATDPRRLKRFLGALALTLLVSSGCLLGAVVAIDPWDQFGQDTFEPLVPNQPRQKLDLYLALDEPPETVLIGASNVRQYQPADAAEVGWGETFNFAAGALSLEEQLALYRFLVDHDLQPDRMVFGVDLIALRPGQATNLRFLTDPLVQPYTDTDFGWFDYVFWSTQYAINQAYIRDMARVLYYSAVGYPDPINTYAPDGGFIYHPDRAPPLVDTPEGRAVLDRHIDTAVGTYARLTEPARQPAKDLRDLVTMAAAEGEVVLFLPPYHPDYRAALQKAGGYDEWRANSLALFQAFCAPGVRVVDASYLEDYGGDPSLFSDGVHVQQGLPRTIMEYVAVDGPDLCADTATEASG